MHANAKQPFVLDDVADAGKDVLIQQRIARQHVRMLAQLLARFRRVPLRRHHIGRPVIEIVQRSLDQTHRACVKVELAVRELESQFRWALLARVDQIAAEQQEVDAHAEAVELQQQVLAPAAQRAQALSPGALSRAFSAPLRFVDGPLPAFVPLAGDADA